MFELFFALSFWPVALFGALVCVLAAATWQESVALALAGLVMYLITGWFLIGINPLLWAYENPVRVLLGAVLYAAVGRVWSVFKWRRYVRSPSVQDQLKAGLRTWSASEAKRNGTSFENSLWFPSRAVASHNKDRITSWIALWPFSMTGYIVGDWLLRAFERVYEALAGVYDNITRQNIPTENMAAAGDDARS